MAVTRNQPILKAPAESRLRLGELLFRRRAELGFGDSRPRFYRATGVNRRYSDDLENARRSNFDEPFLRMAARGYAVTYESLLDVAWGKADALTPVGPLAAPVLPSAPPSGLLREDAARPYFLSVYDRVLAEADKGNPDPTGAQLGLPPEYADVWDATRGRMSRGDRAWTVAEVQRREAARREAGNADANSA